MRLEVINNKRTAIKKKKKTVKNNQNSKYDLVKQIIRGEPKDAQFYHYIT